MNGDSVGEEFLEGNEIMLTSIQEYATTAATQWYQPVKQSSHNTLDSMSTSTFFQAILEGFVDAILIVTQEGEVVHANAKAIEVCQNLPSHPSGIPQEAWHICQLLIDSKNLLPQQTTILESEVKANDSASWRLRGRWLSFGNSKPYILITMEDCDESLKNQTLLEIKKYGFTSREAEVWSLKRTHHSYKQIAAKLFISENTVKKHIKNINLKRREVTA